MPSAADHKTRWGILGTGNIASTFARDLKLLPDAEVVAVGSRSQETAETFGASFDIPRRYPSYQELVEDPDVDVVYVSTPHTMHHPAALQAIRAGKAVLVEKPFTINAAEARELAAEARVRGTFLMEAMWTRFLPHVIKIRELLAAGRLGPVRSFVADHGQWLTEATAYRLHAPELGGGALLDLGIYPVSFASMLFGRPAKITAVSDKTAKGVDAQTGILLQYSGGEQAVLFTSLETRTANRATISGIDARIEVDGVFYAPSPFRVVHRDGAEEWFRIPHEGHGLRHQAAEVGRCLREGRTESDILPLDESIGIMETLDEIRRQIDVRYPSEM